MSSELTKNEAASSIFAAYIKAFQNYFNFKGRTCRYDYWGFALVNFLVSLLLSIVGSIGSLVAYVSMIYNLLVLIPCLAIFIRRLHDVDKSFLYWFVLPLVILVLFTFIAVYYDLRMLGVLLAILFVVFWIAVFIFLCKKGNVESNKYGAPIIESKKQDKIAKWLIFLLGVLPIVLMICVLAVEGILGYNKAMQNLQNRQIQIQEEVNLEQPAEAVQAQEENASESEVNEVNQTQDISVEVKESAGEAEANEVDQAQEINVEVNENAGEAVNEEAE